MHTIAHAQGQPAPAAAIAALLATLLVAASGHAAGAQESAPPSASPDSAYRAPTIVLVQPASGDRRTVPHDRPVVTFRFAQGAPAEPLDLRSFLVAVDGQDKTALFQVSASEAWGPLADRLHPLAPGDHAVTARICSTRGVCAAVSATVTAVADPAASAAGLAPALRLLESDVCCCRGCISVLTLLPLPLGIPEKA